MTDPVVTKFNLQLARSAATDLVDVTGGMAVLNRRYPISYRTMGFDDVGRASSATLTDDGVLTHVPGSQDHR